MPDGRTLEADAYVMPESVQAPRHDAAQEAGNNRGVPKLGKRIIGSAFRALNDSFGEHRTILQVGLAYILLGGLIQFVLERPWPLQLTNRWFTSVWVALSLPWLAWQWVRHPKRLAACLAPERLVGALTIFALALPVQITFQSLKQSIGPVLGFSWDRWLSSVDQFLHAGPAWHWFGSIVNNGRALGMLDVIYKLWFIALLGFILWGCWSKRRALRQRALLASLLLWILGGTIGAALFASAGPCYYDDVAEANSAYEELLTLTRRHDLWATRSQDGLWVLRQQDGWKHFGGISAFPSMHVGFAVLVAIVAWRVHRGLGAILWAFAGLTQIGSVVLAWHYAVDGYAGALIAWGCWHLAKRMSRRQ